jgi:hypothetical protein
LYVLAKVAARHVLHDKEYLQRIHIYLC